MTDTRAVYDRVAPTYGREFAGELAKKPLDRALLAAFAERVLAMGVPGRVFDVGTGSGQVAAFLAQLGVGVAGVDPSPGMLEAARVLFPSVPFVLGSFESLPCEPGTLLGATAFYAIVHHLTEELGPAMQGLARALRPGAPFLLSFHVGTETVKLEAWLGADLPIEFHFHPIGAVRAAMEQAGLEVEAILERKGDALVEHPSVRAYLWGRRAAG